MKHEAAFIEQFTQLPDLAGERLGGMVLWANDEFFASKDNLLKSAAPAWHENRFTDRGKWMDGWETRRRREPGHDQCLVRLGLPGVVHGVVVDTTHFRGNFPESCALEGCALEGNPQLEQFEAPDTEWVELVPHSPLEGNRPNEFMVDTKHRVTHLRLRIFPDGGVARLRVHGEVVCDWAELAAVDAAIDLLAMRTGGRVLSWSDRFFSTPAHMLLPGDPLGMWEGWETRRRRGAGHDWVIAQLATEGSISAVEVDTTWFKGNAPAACALEGTRAPGASVETLESSHHAWESLLPREDLQPHHRHRFERQLQERGPFTHVRLSIYPDGGIGRLRLFGRPSRDGWRRAGVRRLDALMPRQAERELLTCCGSRKWARRMVDAGPHRDFAALLKAADQLWWGVERSDWLEAFAAHPRIGERKAAVETGARAQQWSSGEQAGADGAANETRDELARLNAEYEQRFGWIYIVCATGKSADEMLEILRQRLENAPEKEIVAAAEEQQKITRLRLEKLLCPEGAEG